MSATPAGFDDQDFDPDIYDKPPSWAGASLATIPCQIATLAWESSAPGSSTDQVEVIDSTKNGIFFAETV